jgi:ribosomal protein S18 acetylase RimI-like enzyme
VIERARTIRSLERGELPNAAALLGRAMRDNPLHVRAFGADPDTREHRLERMFVVVLPRAHAHGRVLGAFDGDTLVGVCAMVAPGECHLSTSEKLCLTPLLAARLGPAGLYRLLQWTGTWARFDPPDGHWHLGPIGVDRELQGRGIGSALLREVTNTTRDAPAYLETDKPENVRFYQRFGFVVRAEAQALGTLNWFMSRDRS